MLPEEAYLGQRPPTLSDYLDESVSMQTALPATQKIVVIQGLEVSSLDQGAN
jgi:hypothetical protein